MLILKWAVIASLGFFLVIYAVLFFIGVNGDGSTVKVIKHSESPDGRQVAELQQVTTSMHGGPDRIEVTISGIVVYAKKYECGPDYAAWSLAWKDVDHLNVTYGTCDEGRYRDSHDNDVFTQLTAMRNIKINYINSGHVVHDNQ